MAFLPFAAALCGVTIVPSPQHLGYWGAREAAMKLGVVGKGGVGKTTVAALLARAYADRGRRVAASLPERASPTTEE